MTPVEAAERNLHWLLKPVTDYLDNPSMTDFHINGAGSGKCFVDCGRGYDQITLPYSWDDLDLIAINAASYTSQDIGEDVPLVSAKFPGGHRVQIVRPPAVPDGSYAFSIRQPKKQTSTPAELEAQGVFRRAVARRDEASEAMRATGRLLELYQAKRWREFLELAIRTKHRIVFAGPVGTGKTHIMRAFTHAIPLSWRLITIEDMQEMINLPHRNVVHLLYSKGRQSVADVDSDDLVAASLRMGPDGLFHQELRDEAAYSFMQVLDSGHFGMTTTHAESAEDTRERILSLVKSHPKGAHLEDEKVRTALHKSIDVIVYCARDGSAEDAPRYIEQILYDPEAKARLANVRGLFQPAA